MDLSVIISAPWRAYAAALLAAAGILLLGKGLWFGFAGSQGLLREREALGWMRGFRLAVVGLCLVGIAVAWVSFKYLETPFLRPRTLNPVLSRSSSSADPQALGAAGVPARP